MTVTERIKQLIYEDLIASGDLDEEASPEEITQAIGDRLRILLREVRGALALKPIELDLMRVPGTGLREMLKALKVDDAVFSEFDRADSKLRKVRVVLRHGMIGDEVSAIVKERLYAPKSGVTPVEYNFATTRDELLQRLQAVAGNDLAGAPMPVVDTQPRMSHAMDLPDGRLAVTYVWKTRAQAVVAPDRSVVEPEEAVTATVIVNPATGAAVIHGGGSVAEKVAARFADDVTNAGLKVELERLSFEDVDRVALKAALSAKTKREHYLDPDGQATGAGERSIALHHSPEWVDGDLEDTPAHQELPADRDVKRQYITFPFDGEDYSMYLNLRDGRLYFAQGNVPEAVVRHVLDTIKRLRGEGAGAA